MITFRVEVSTDERGVVSFLKFCTFHDASLPDSKSFCVSRVCAGMLSVPSTITLASSASWLLTDRKSPSIKITWWALPEVTRRVPGECWRERRKAAIDKAGGGWRRSMLVTVSSPPGTHSSEALPSRGKMPGGELRCLGKSHLLQKTKQKGRPSNDSVGAKVWSCRLPEVWGDKINEVDQKFAVLPDASQES